MCESFSHNLTRSPCTCYVWTGLSGLGVAASIGAERRTAATACTISICGNMAFVGTSRGGVHCFNVQSGRVRRTYHRPSRSSASVKSKSKKAAHGSAVTGVKCGGLNRLLFTSAVDGRVRVWRIATGECVDFDFDFIYRYISRESC